MPKPVKGFMSEDEQFFATEDEARKHELELQIRDKCGEFDPPINPDRLFPVLEAMADIVMEYLNVCKGTTEELPNPRPRKHRSNDGSTEAHPETIQSFTTDGHQPMSDMGGRSSSKAVRD
jgi:hypothetical protein